MGGAKKKKDILVRTVDIVNGQNGQVTVISEVAQGDPGTSLEVAIGNGLLRDIEGDGHGEEVSIGQTAVFADTAPVLLVHEAWDELALPRS